MTDWLFLAALLVLAIKIQDNSSRIDKIEKKQRKEDKE